MSIHTDVNPAVIQDRISTNIKNEREKNVDVRSVLKSLVDSVTEEMETPNVDDSIDATWRVIERERPYANWSHTQRTYAICFLFRNYGVSPDFIAEDGRVRHGKTWNDITRTLCEYGFYEVTHALATGELSPDPHTVGEFNDTRRTSRRQRFNAEIREDPLTNMGVHNWIAILASSVSTRLANEHDIPDSDRTDVQNSPTDETASNEADAIQAVIQDEAHHELYDDNLITAASFLDAVEDLYGMTGEESIESEQLAKSVRSGSWHDALTTGVLSQAMATAIQIHRETFASEFKASLPE